MKKNTILLIVSIGVLILTTLWFFKIVEEPFVAIFGAILTCIGYFFSQGENTTQKPENKISIEKDPDLNIDEQNIRIAICKSNDLNFIFSNKEISHTPITLTYFSFQKPDGIESYLSLLDYNATLAADYKKSIINDPILERELKYCEQLKGFDMSFVVFDARSIVPEANISILKIVRHFTENIVCIILYDNLEKINNWLYRLKSEGANIIEVDRSNADNVWNIFALKYISLIDSSKRKYLLASLESQKE